jgi:transposase-like protein
MLGAFILTGRLIRMVPFTFMLRFPDEEACWAFLEETLWPLGPACPKCDSIGNAARWKPRPHRWQCRKCNAQFHVAQETALRGSHIPMDVWFKAVYLVVTSVRVPSKVLAEVLEIREKTAWSMRKRIRRLMVQDRGLVRQIVAAGR